MKENWTPGNGAVLNPYIPDEKCVTQRSVQALDGSWEIESHSSPSITGFPEEPGPGATAWVFLRCLESQYQVQQVHGCMPSLVSISIFWALDDTFTASSVRNMELRCRPFLGALGHCNPSSFTMKSGGAQGSPSLARLQESVLCLLWHLPHHATRCGARVILKTQPHTFSATRIWVQ